MIELEYLHVVQINLKSALKLSQEAIPHLSITKGNIVNVSSISGLRSSQMTHQYLQPPGPTSVPGFSLKKNVKLIEPLIPRAYPGALAYKMSKAAMDQLTRCSALEVLELRSKSQSAMKITT